MKIVLVSSNYPPFLGGVEIHAQQMANSLSASHRVSVGAINFTACQRPWALEVLHSNLLAPSAGDRMDGPVSVHSLAPSGLERAILLPMALRAAPKLRRWFYHPINAATHPFYRVVVAPKLRRIMRGADVVHGLVHGDIGWAAERVARQEGCPYVCTPFVHPGQWGDGPLDVAYYKRCDAVIGLVESDRAYLESLGVPGSRLRVVGVSPNVSPAADGMAFRKRHNLGNVPIILYVGRMMAQKGAAALMQAAPSVWQSHPEARLVFIGPAAGREAEVFQGADPRIVYLGRLSDEEKADALAGCDIFCMPSSSEILPTVYLEAWSLGKAVVGGPAPGLKELVEGNGGGLIAGQTPQSVSAALLRLFDDPGFRASCGNAGRKLVERNYSVEAVTAQLEAIYEEVSLRSHERNAALQQPASAGKAAIRG